MTMTTAASGEAGQRLRRSQEACREDKHLKQLQRKTVIITLKRWTQNNHWKEAEASQH